jgi:myo-inositol-1-phosphate synthase
MNKTASAPVAEAANGVKKSSKTEVVKKMLADKDITERFFNGEISIDEVHAKGIKFVTPI